MNFKKSKQKWNLAKILCLIGTSFWIIETAYFLIVYGWHWKVINDSEKLCDDIVGFFWMGGLVVAASVMIDVVEYLFSDNELN